MTTVRTMTWDNLDAVMRLEQASPEAPHWPRTVYEAFLAEGGLPKRVFVAASQEALTGFVAARATVDVCELQSLVVALSARRAGVARLLLACLVKWARELDLTRVEIEVRSGNTSAIAFYEKSGFKRDGLRRAYYAIPQEDALLMSLPLESAIGD